MITFIDTNNLIHEIKTGDVYEDFSKGKKIFDFSNCLKSKYDFSRNLVVDKNERWNSS